MDWTLAWGGPEAQLDDATIRAALAEYLQRIDADRMLVIPPDFSRYFSYAGRITEILYELAGDRIAAILPALGTHRPMTDGELEGMYGSVPRRLFRDHDWRNDVTELGTVPREFVREVSDGLVDYDWPAQVNRLLVSPEEKFDAIISVGQVVPHEVIGLANHAKNIFVGTGGSIGINRSHFLGAVYGMERIMGRADNPVRAVLNYAAEHFLADLPVSYLLTVMEPIAGREKPVMRGLFAGVGQECFYRAADLTVATNLTFLDEAPDHVVAYLDPDEFHSTWLGNKAIYRSRMAIADGGTLTIIAPGVEGFGEDHQIDRLIRRHGYLGRDATLAAVDSDPELAQDLSAAAHLIHGSSEGRFTIEYAAGGLSAEEISGVGYVWKDVREVLQHYPVREMETGWHTQPDGERIYVIKQPALGLWAERSKFM
ncbi:MAG: lactate racemase domain-containing protein [Alkalispirochaeta sp.]